MSGAAHLGVKRNWSKRVELGLDPSPVVAPAQSLAQLLRRRPAGCPATSRRPSPRSGQRVSAPAGRAGRPVRRRRVDRSGRERGHAPIRAVRHVAGRRGRDHRAVTSALPLARFRVLDLTRVRSGPTAVRQLADWGADVVMVEPAGAGDDIVGGRATARTSRTSTATSAASAWTSRRPRAAPIFHRLVERRRRRARELPARRQAPPRHRLRDAARRSTRASSTAASPASARTARTASGPGFDQIAQGIGGLMSVTGLPGSGTGARRHRRGRQLRPASILACGVLTALLEREVTGVGRWVSTSLLQAQIAMLDFQAARWTRRRGGARPAGQQPPDGDADGHVPRRRRTVNIAASGRRMFAGFCAGRRRRAPPRRRALRRQPRPLRQPRRARRRDRGHRRPAAPWPSGSTCSTRRASPAGRSTRWTPCSPTRRCSTSAWPGPSPTTSAATSPSSPRA